MILTSVTKRFCGKINLSVKPKPETRQVVPVFIISPILGNAIGWMLAPNTKANWNFKIEQSKSNVLGLYFGCWKNLMTLMTTPFLSRTDEPARRVTFDGFNWVQWAEIFYHAMSVTRMFFLFFYQQSTQTWGWLFQRHRQIVLPTCKPSDKESLECPLVFHLLLTTETRWNWVREGSKAKRSSAETFQRLTEA